MKKIKLKNGEIALIDNEDFEKVNSKKWTLHSKGYATSYVKVSGKWKTILMHRFILNPNINQIIDHKNFNRLDNRKSNIRICTKQNNNSYRGLSLRNKSGYKGVSWHKHFKKWRASISFNGKHKQIGYFDNKIEAAKAYNETSKILFGDFSFINNV